MIHIFYRQGQAINVSAADVMQVELEEMTGQDLGMMYLINSRALIASSSSKILFFKQIIDEDDENIKRWTLYEEIL
jgi:hypothetical protein